jgi:hypothetical protein
VTKSQALSKARKLFGPNAVVRDAGFPTSPEARADARNKLAALRATTESKRSKDFRKQESELVALAVYRRCSVGRIQLGFYCIEGEGDNFAEALEDAQNWPELRRC